MKIVIIGCKGMLGTDLLDASRRRDIAAAGFDLPEMDITDPDSVRRNLPAADAVVNCAAWTAVDDAEKNRDRVFAVNARAPENLARRCREMGLPLVHISTDYVFDGSLDRPYHEDDAVHPLGVYGASKLAGEQAIQGSGCRHVIVRTQSLFGKHGKNFVRSIVTRLEQNQPLRVVSDQVSSPTWTRHLADGLLDVLASGREGVVHVASRNGCSWHEFASAVVARVRPGTPVAAIGAADLNLPARRPAYSMLDTSRFAQWAGRPMPTWQEALDGYLKEEGWMQ